MQERAPQLSWHNIIAATLVVLTAAGGSYALIQQQFSAMEREFKRATDLNSAAIGDVKRLVEELTAHTIERREHAEFVKRLDTMDGVLRDQLRIIETTRPTTGELLGVAQATKDQLGEVKERIKSLEEYMRRPQSLAPVTLPAPATPH